MVTRLAPAERRRQILEAARGLYVDRAYQDVSIGEIADAAGVARGLIHHYYGDKRELFLAVMRESVVLPTSALPDMHGLDLTQRARAITEWILDGAVLYGQAWVNASGAADLHVGSDTQAIIDEADDRAARLVLDELGLADSFALRVRLRASAAMTKAVCREWLQRKTLTRNEASDILTSTLVLLVTGPDHLISTQPGEATP